jgi:hypothetical protein
LTASFAAIAPVPNLTVLDNEFNILLGAAGALNGGTTGTKLLVKASDGADPPLEIDQVGAGPLAEWKQNGTLLTSIGNSGQIISAVTTGTAPLSVASTTAVTNLNADLLDGRHLVGLLVSFSVAFVIPDPSTASLSSREFGSFIVPAGGTYTFTKGKVMFRTGSHTAGGSLTFKIEQVFVGDKSTLTLDNTNNTIATIYPDNFGDFTAVEDSIFNAYISARSGTITERDVTVVLEGFRTVF